MSHADAMLTPTGRLRLARCIVDQGWPLRRAAERFGVSVTTAQRWAGRYRREGRAGMLDRSSRPNTCPRRLPARTERRIMGLRVFCRWGPARIAYRLKLHPSMVHKVLTRYEAPRLTWTDPATGCRLRAKPKPVRYEHPAPGDLVHVDIKKLGRIPDGGGHRVHGRAKGNRVKKSAKPGTAYIHHALDEHSRLVYSEILTDERKEIASEFWTRANAYFAACGITVLRVLTDNGSTSPRTPATTAVPAADRPRACWSAPPSPRSSTPPPTPCRTGSRTGSSPRRSGSSCATPPARDRSPAASTTARSPSAPSSRDNTSRASR